ncbi:tatD [Mytilus edulis]|uniref:TatD n=1 Tax=Mytilus edulis TaxID=6550 RepID=A0A8S3V1M8_MYTED|nr:tatD [Mytilus edulis]
MEDDVLSLSAHGESIGDDSSSKATELSDMMVIDEVGYEDNTDEPSDSREVQDEGIYNQYVHNQRSAGALGPAPYTVTSSSQEIESNSMTTFKSRSHKCFVCGLVTHGKMRRHVLKTHLPWYWEPHTACWSCEVQEAQAGSLAQRHTMEHGVEKRTVHVRQNQFSSQELQLLTFWADNYCPSSVPTYICNPPNHLICLFNWELIAVLLSRVGSVKQERFLVQKQRLTYEGANIAEPISQSEDQLAFVDSHFHLDQILRRMRLRNFQHLQSLVAPGCSQYFYYGVANYVFPSRWNNWASDVGFARSVYVSFGIHPHITAEGISKRQMDQLDSLTDSHLCVAIGEVGLDYTTTCICRPCRNPSKCKEEARRNQEEAFVQMLLLARRKHFPVIIHCRDCGDGSAAKRTLEIILYHDLVDMKFYRHCFDGTIEEMTDWQQLPTIIFGVSVKFIRDNTGLEVIPRIPPHQLVLETDSPFLSPFPWCPVNHPWNLSVIAKEVSRLRNIPLSVLMWTVNDNALKFFQIPRQRQ